MKSVIQHIQRELKDVCPESEIKGITRLLLEHVLQLGYSGIMLNKDLVISPVQREMIEKMTVRVKNGEPVQYVTGETEFYGLKIMLNRSVLIPRPETEELVHWIIREIPARDQRILDVGTGSGCLALALKNHYANAPVTAADLSDDILRVAESNAALNKLELNTVKSDILHWENYSWADFDLIVSNPPYVTESEKRVMAPNVLDHEPASALFVPDSDPLIFYRRIAEMAQKHLKINGWLFFEINEHLGKEMAGLLEGMHFTRVELKRDINGKDRMVRCQKSH